MTTEGKRAKMQTLASDWRESGMTQQCYARKNNISIHTLRYWLYKKGAIRKSTGSFLQLKSYPVLQEYIIRYPNGVELRIPLGMPLENIRTLLNL
jgi:DNA-binding transcriptional MerR regulator